MRASCVAATMSVVRAMLLADNQHAQRLHGMSVLAVCILSIVATTPGACASAIGCHCTRMPSKLPLWHCVVQAFFVHAVFCCDVLDMMVLFCQCLKFQTDVSSRFTTTHGPCDFLCCTSHWVHLTKIPALLRSSSLVNERTFSTCRSCNSIVIESAAPIFGQYCASTATVSSGCRLLLHEVAMTIF